MARVVSPAEQAIREFWPKTVPDIELMLLEYTLDDLNQKFGPPQIHDPGVFEPGPCDLWIVDLINGLKIVIVAHFAKPITVLYSNSFELDFILKQLGDAKEKWRLDPSVLEGRVAEVFKRFYTSERFELFRIDDNGVEYVISSGMGPIESKCMLEDFERRHHKQTYFLRKSA